MKPLLLASLLLLLAACAVIERVRGPSAPAEPVASAPATLGQGGARTAEAFDQTSAAEKAAALSAGGGGGAALGEVVVSLGAPTEPGFWLRTALVPAPSKGRVVTDEGASIAVDLLPGSGAAQLSLPAFRALGLPLTGLPRVTVYAEGR